VASLKRIPAARAALLGSARAGAGPVWVWLFDGERPDDLTLLGGVIVIGRRRGKRVAGFTAAHWLRTAHDPEFKGPVVGPSSSSTSRASWPAPYCTLLMAEMGARVIKVEPPKGGDDARAYGPFVKGKSTYFASVNRGRKASRSTSRTTISARPSRSCSKKADVIVENFRPGTMEKLGYGWDTLHKKYPQADLRRGLGFRPYRPQLQGSRLRHGRAGQWAAS